MRAEVEVAIGRGLKLREENTQLSRDLKKLSHEKKELMEALVKGSKAVT